MTKKSKLTAYLFLMFFVLMELASTKSYCAGKGKDTTKSVPELLTPAPKPEPRITGALV
jgi:hypothetical protein